MDYPREGKRHGGGSVSVKASRNTSSNPRIGVVTIKTASGLTKTVPVSQGVYERIVRYWGTIEYLGEAGDYYRYQINWESEGSFYNSSGDRGYLCLAPYHPRLDSDLDNASMRFQEPDSDNDNRVVEILKSLVVDADGEPIDPTDSGWTVGDFSDLYNDGTVSTLYQFDKEKSSYFTSNTVFYQIAPASNSESALYRIRFRKVNEAALVGGYTVQIRYKNTSGSYTTKNYTISGQGIVSGNDYGAWFQLSGITKDMVSDFDIFAQSMAGMAAVRLERELYVNHITLSCVQIGSSMRTFSYECEYTPLPSGLTMDVVDTEGNEQVGIQLNTSGSGTFTVPKNDPESGTTSIDSMTIHPSPEIGCLLINN